MLLNQSILTFKHVTERRHSWLWIAYRGKSCLKEQKYGRYEKNWDLDKPREAGGEEKSCSYEHDEEKARVVTHVLWFCVRWECRDGISDLEKPILEAKLCW